MDIVLATHNQHKVAEFQRMLDERMPRIRVIAYDGPEPVEDGASFSENALIKARVASAHTGLASLADDSGICVDIFGGAPGIFSARWAGSAHDSAANLALLVDQLRDVRDEHRGASFACHIAIVVPGANDLPAREHVVAGQWEGSLAREPLGEHGFGYDPIFVPEGETRTSAQLSPEEKNRVSHRARALKALIPVLETL